MWIPNPNAMPSAVNIPAARPPAQHLLRNEYKIGTGRHARQKIYAGDNPKAMPKSHTEAFCIKEEVVERHISL